jgi:hypothetical protein
VISRFQLASISTGKENKSLKLVFSLTIVVLILDVEAEAIVAGVDTCRVKAEESILPPFEAFVIIVIPDFACVEIGFLTLVTVKLTIDPAAIALDGLIEFKVKISLEKSHVSPEFRI